MINIFQGKNIRQATVWTVKQNNKTFCVKTWLS